MKNIFLCVVLCVFGVLCALVIGTIVDDSAQAQRRPQPTWVPIGYRGIGRFQISGNLRIDTVTGRTWEAKRITLMDADASRRFAWYEFITVPRVVPQRVPAAVRPLRIVPVPTTVQPFPNY